VFCGRDIPSGGLKQDMLHNDVRLNIDDIMRANGNPHDHVQVKISKYFILDTIRSAFSKETRRIDSRGLGEYLTIEMPKFEILPQKRRTR
jgi:hypothetical protein